MKMKIRQGDVFWVDMDKVFPDLPHYQKGIRPCLVISNNYQNTYSDMINIIPLTSKYDGLPQHRFIYVRNTRNYLLPEMTTTINISLILKKMGYVSEGYIQQALKSIRIQFDMERRMKHVDRRTEDNSREKS